MAYRILDLSPYGGQFADFHVKSSAVLNAAVTFVDNVIGGGGYYSGFSKDISNAGIGSLGIQEFNLFCSTSLPLLAQGGIDYEWSALNSDHWQYLNQTSDSTYTFTPTQDLEYGVYQYQVITSVELINTLRKDTTILSINYREFDQTFGGDQRVCTNQSTQLNPAADAQYNEYYLWKDLPQLSQTQVSSPIFSGEMSLIDQRVPVDVSYDDGYCQFTGTVEVIVEDCRRSRIQDAWVYDLDSNGRAETFKITFDDVFIDFDNITSIDWTQEGVDSRSSSQAIVRYDTLSDGSLDSTTVILYFDSQFAFGTAPDSLLTPYISYYFDSVQVRDRIGPVVSQSEKIYPEDEYYGVKKQDGSIEYFESPVQIHVTSSEVILVDPNNFQELFVFKDVNGQILDINFMETPQLSEDGVTWVLKVDPEDADLLPLIHSTSLNNQIPIEDLQGNITQEYNQQVQDDINSPVVRTYQQFRENIVGDRFQDVVNFNGAQVNIYDEEGKLLERIPHQTKIESKWVAPYNFINGKIDPNAPCVDNQVITEFPPSCLASLIVGSYKSKGAYQATSYIYDHLGQFVTKVSQKFGYCGELDNPSRVQLSSNQHLLLNELIWDLKDTQGRKVGVGVYVWKVLIEFENGDKETIIQRMGTMRESEVCQE